MQISSRCNLSIVCLLTYYPLPAYQVSDWDNVDDCRYMNNFRKHLLQLSCLIKGYQCNLSLFQSTLPVFANRVMYIYELAVMATGLTFHSSATLTNNKLSVMHKRLQTLLLSLLTPGLGYLQMGDKKSFFKTIALFFGVIILGVTLKLLVNFWGLSLIIVTLLASIFLLQFIRQ